MSSLRDEEQSRPHVNPRRELDIVLKHDKLNQN